MIDIIVVKLSYKERKTEEIQWICEKDDPLNPITKVLLNIMN